MLKAARNWLVGVSLCALAAVAGAADTVSWNSLTVPVQFTAGSGSNTAMCVLDFAGTGNDVRYAFLYKFDGTSTSFDMLTALDAASESFSFTSITSYGSPYVTGLSYNGYSMTDDNLYVSEAKCLTAWWDGHAAYPGFPSGTVDAENPSGVFATTGQGVSDRVLTDGYADGWTQNTVATWGTNAPLYPTSVPEPASIALLSIAAVGLLRRSKKLSKQV